MMSSLLIVYFVIAAILISVFTIVFCFWSVYLFEFIRRKKCFYKNAQKCLKRGDCDNQQRILVYNAKTELVKYKFLFVINLVEWLSVLSLFVGFSIKTGYYEQPQIENNSSLITIIKTIQGLEFETSTMSTFNLTNNFSILALVLNANLCMYLASRFANKSWIKSNIYSIPIVSSYLILSQILSSFCSLLFIWLLFNTLLFTFSLIFLTKQFKMLIMTIEWSITDLKVSQNQPLLSAHIKMKNNFKKLFKFLWLGSFLILLWQYIHDILLLSWFIIRSKNSSSIDITLRKFSIPNK